MIKTNSYQTKQIVEVCKIWTHLRVRSEHKHKVYTKDLKTQSKTINYPNRVNKGAIQDSDKKDKSFEATGLGSKILSVVLSYPYLAREIEDLDKFSNFNEPEVRLMTEVVAFFIEWPEDGIEWY